MLVTKKDPPMSKSIAKFLNTSLAAIIKIVNLDMHLKKVKNHNIQQHLPRHMTQCRTFCRILYVNYLTGDKWKYIVILDKTWVYLSDCNKNRSIYYQK